MGLRDPFVSNESDVTALDVQHTPGRGQRLPANVPAANITQNATSGLGTALTVTSRNASVEALRVRGGLNVDTINVSAVFGGGYTIVSKEDMTTNPAAAVMAGITNLPSTGGKVVLPDGDYTLESAILINKANIIIEGTGGATRLFFNANTTAAAIKMADTTQRQCHVRDLQISCTSGSAGLGTAIDASYFINSTFENLRIGTSNAPNIGIDFNALGSYYNTVRECRISTGGTNSICVRFDNTSNSNNVVNCRLLPSATGKGVYVNAHDNSIYHVDIESIGAIGIHVDTIGNGCQVYSAYLEAVDVGLQLEAGIESFVMVGGIIIDCDVANIVDNGAKEPMFLNTRVQYEPYTNIAIRTPSFTNAYPVPGNIDLPQDHGLAAWSFDPATATATSTMTNGTQFLASIYIRQPVTVTKIWHIVTTAATTPTSGQSQVGIFNSSGTLLVSANIADADITSNGPRSTTIASTTLAPGRYWVAFLCNAATAVQLARAGGQSAAGNSINQLNSQLRFAVNGTAKTALDASITPSSNSVTGSVAFFTAVS